MFTYKAIDLNITKEDIDLITKEIKSISASAWHWNEYRNCEIILILDKDFKWTKEGKTCTHLIKVFKDKIKPIMSSEGKINILKTKKGNHVSTHIDCKQIQIPEFHQKLRLALTGKLDSLYFLDEDGNKVYAPNTYNTYILNGGHPHGLVPNEEKITVCIGAPWRGEDKYSNELFTMNVTPPKLKKEWITSIKNGGMEE